jgi:hypothetical protein
MLSTSAIVIVNDVAEWNALDLVWNYLSRLLDLPGQATLLILMIGLLIWTIVHTRRDNYLWLQMKSWIQSSMGLIILVAILMYISPIVLPDSDPFALYRVVVLRSASFLVGLFFITGGILFVSKVLFPEGLFKQIIETTYGPTAILCSIILGLIYLATYS